MCVGNHYAAIAFGFGSFGKLGGPEVATQPLCQCSVCRLRAANPVGLRTFNNHPCTHVKQHGFQNVPWVLLTRQQSSMGRALSLIHRVVALFKHYFSLAARENPSPLLVRGRTLNCCLPLPQERTPPAWGVANGSFDVSWPYPTYDARLLRQQSPQRCVCVKWCMPQSLHHRRKLSAVCAGAFLL